MQSRFNSGEDIVGLISQTRSVPAIRQPNGNVQRTVTLDRPVGIDRATGPATNTYTVITDAGDTLVTAFPGSE